MKNTVKEEIKRVETGKMRNLKAFTVSQRAIKQIRKLEDSFFSKYSDMLREETGQKPATKSVEAKRCIASIMLTVLAIFLSCVEMGQDAYPLSVAILCASGAKKRGALFSPKLIISLSLSAVIISTMFMNTAGVLYFAIFLAIFVIRSILTSASYNERISFKVMTSFFASCVIGGILTIVSDYSLLSLVSFATLATVTPVFTYLFACLYGAIGVKRITAKPSEKFKAGVLSVMFCILYAISDIYFIGLSISALTAFCISIAVAKKYSSIEGAITGTVLGAACASPVFAAVFGVNALLCGLFFPSDLYALLTSVPVCAILSVFLGGSNGFLSVMPETVAGFLILWPILAKIKPVKSDIERENIKRPLLQYNGIKNNLEKISGTFSGLSEIFFAVAQKNKPLTSDEIYTFVESACSGICASCSVSAMCWSKKWNDTHEALNSVSKTLIEKGTVTPDDFPEYFSEQCKKTESLCSAVNRSISGYCYSRNNVNMIAGEYKTVSKVLKSTAEKFANAPQKDEKTAKKVSELLKKLGISHRFVEAWGGRNTVIDVAGVYPEKIHYSTLDLLSALENICFVKFEEPEFIQTGKEYVMRLCRRREIRLECAKNTCAKRGEHSNGDTISFFESDAGMFYSLICDGMGSGREAALTSKLASVFLEKLLSCMNDRGISVEMLNQMLISKDGETFTTVDLAEIDLYEKTATFIKAGASPSFILRGGKIYKINSKTPPAGIIDNFYAEETRIKIQDGDTIILVSDGIFDSSSTFPLAEIIAENASLCASELAEKILSSSLSHFKAHDDMSVVAIKVYSD